MGRHAFAQRWLDMPSLQPERVPAHRAPKHRKDVPVDSCRFDEGEGAGPCVTCAEVETVVLRVHRVIA